MRRGIGVSGLQEEAMRQRAFEERGAALEAETVEKMKLQMIEFQKNLEIFAKNHKKEIQTNPEFRTQFHKMCATAGVDPLTSTKGVWSEVLGVGNYYYELAIRTAEICINTRVLNGGMLEVSECKKRLEQKRFTYTEHVSEDDIERAVKKLKVLQGGFDIVRLGKKSVIQSIPMELSPDHTTILRLAENTGFLTLSSTVNALKWQENRVRDAFEYFLQHEIAWIDTQTKESTYWFLGLVKGAAL
uniref:Vacuolar-sorting protein SNF8 n=1 Tax=Timspurckia oligopyrenoides TaxID=708627 RepID=A0A7S0ZAI5_9RHOD|mmetsp:Transcript_10163/g.18302  ORF Transcript_10163/g.18302 Transcript_10163/m.18302 type:complete len:244 (+) Transcript_10163:129-860(+)